MASYSKRSYMKVSYKMSKEKMFKHISGKDMIYVLEVDNCREIVIVSSSTYGWTDDSFYI